MVLRIALPRRMVHAAASLAGRVRHPARPDAPRGARRRAGAGRTRRSSTPPRSGAAGARAAAAPRGPAGRRGCEPAVLAVLAVTAVSAVAARGEAEAARRARTAIWRVRLLLAQWQQQPAGIAAHRRSVDLDHLHRRLLRLPV